MKIYSIIGTIGLIVNLGTAPDQTNYVEITPVTQTLQIPSHEITFKRGTYSIISPQYDKSTILKKDEITQVLLNAGFLGDGLKMAIAIATLESTLKPFAFNNASNCYGLFQINMSGAMGPDRRKKYGLKSNEDLFNPLINAQIAYKMSNGGKNWSAWTTESAARKLVDG